MIDKNLPLRPNVCMIVLNSEGDIFMGERKGEAGKWQFPQGGVEPGLSLEENVLKELSEEIGAKKSLFRIIRKLKATNDYEFLRPPDYAKGRWRGQSQSFWLVDFLGEDSDIDLEAHNPEFMDFKWCSLAEVRKIAEPVRLPGYNRALAEIEAELEASGSRSSKNKVARAAKRRSQKDS